MVCHHCGNPVPEGQARCPYCLTPVKQSAEHRSCTSCGNPLEPEDKFCKNCGTLCPAEKTAPQQFLRRCTRCGNQLCAEDQFCKNCGAPCAIVPAVETAPPIPELRCTHCGTPLAQDDSFCSVCGRAIEKKAKKGRSPGVGRIIGIAAALMVLAVVIIAIVQLSTNTPKYVAKSHIEDVLSGDAEAVLDSYPPEVVEGIMDRELWTGYEMEAEIDEELDRIRTKIIKSYGKNWTQELEVLEVTGSDWDNQQSKEERYKEYYGVEIDIEDWKTVLVEVYIEGGGDRDLETIEVSVLKIDGTWYVDFLSCDLI